MAEHQHQTRPAIEPGDFDHHSAQCTAGPAAYYAAFRAGCPVGRTPAHGGFVYTTRYADVVRVARDDAAFSSARAATGEDRVAIVIPSGPGLEQYPIELDPPAATGYRDLINPLLTPAAVEWLRPMIARHVTRTIDAFAAEGSADLVRDLTNPVPAAITLDWLGFPEDDWARLAGPIHDIFAAPPDSERARRGAQGLAYMEERIRELVRQRRAAPAGDAVSMLAAQRGPGGEPFGEDELVSVIGLLIAGGVDTTTSLTGSVLVHLSRHPDQRRQLIESPDLLESATEEFLRVFAPSQSMARTAMADTQVGGCPVRPGERVLIPWVAANHDPAVFPEPDRVRLDRDASRHLSFGIGTHRCAGAHLARAMFREMIAQMLARLPDLRVLEDGLIGYPTSGNQTGWDSIPAVFTPSPRTAEGGTTLAAGPIGAAFEMTVAHTEAVADGVLALTLARADGSDLPAWEPGAHLELRLPSGRVRQYSLCGDPDDRTRYRVAVLREEDGRGGSAELHALARPGTRFTVRGPRNHFPLVPAGGGYLFLAGGIGITPILAMARAAARRGAALRVLYGGRTRTSMAFRDELHALAGGRLQIMPQDETGLPDLRTALAAAGPETAVYCCGPPAMISAAEQICADLDISDRLYVERFTGDDSLEVAFDPASNTEFEVHLARTGRTLRVPADRRLIEVVQQAVPGLSYDCEKGYCGACETRVLGGVPEHRDSLLTEAERATGQTMMICVGRCSTPRLVLDI